MIAARARVSMSPLWLLILVLLPFLPVSLPAALLVWSGPLGSSSGSALRC